jgi:hypothetical protein
MLAALAARAADRLGQKFATFARELRGKTPVEPEFPAQPKPHPLPSAVKLRRV